MIDGITVPIYSLAKTVVDCFRFRNKIGFNVALEALLESRRSKKTTINEINRFAKLVRLERVMRPYLEALRRLGQVTRVFFPKLIQPV